MLSTATLEQLRAPAGGCVLLHRRLIRTMVGIPLEAAQPLQSDPHDDDHPMHPCFCDESSLPTPPMQVPPPGPASSCCGLAASVGKQHAGPRSDAELALPAVAATRSTQDHGNFLCRLWAAVAASIRSDVRREGASDRPLPARSADARLALLEHYSLDRVSPVTALQRSWSSGLRPIRSLESSERFGPQP